MKLRLIGTPEEWNRFYHLLEERRHLFDSYRKPQSGSNPKYADNPQLLFYGELTIESLAELFCMGTVDTGYQVFNENSIVSDAQVVNDGQLKEVIKTTIKALPAPQRLLGDGLTISFKPKK